MPPRTTDSSPERRDDDRPRPDQEPAQERSVPALDAGTGTEAPVGRAPHSTEVPDTGQGGGSAGGATERGGASADDTDDTDAPGVDPRVAAVRRAADGGRRWRAAQLAGCAALLAVALTGGAVAFGGVGGGSTGTGVDTVSASGALTPGALARGDLDSGIVSLQKHLRAQPRDFGSWATLGVAYVEQARTKGDPSRYPQAERALKRSLELEPDNDQALAGRAALAAARHDFTGALAHADRALKQNPYNERALCSRVDALVELGRYDDAAEAARTADDRRPGVPVFTRYAYVHELRGDVRTARAVLERALSQADSPADVAYVATALGQLAWNQGEYKTALGHYARALAADEEYLPALEGRARAQAASGDRAAAAEGLERVVARFPLPGPLVALGELYEARGADGDRAKAGDQYALVDAWTALARAGGVNADLDTAMAAADHGDKKEALRAARAEWNRRHSVHTADALAWALHVNGRDKEALPYARRATATGYRNAAFLYHRGIIERATGDDRDARTHLKAALELNPGFSPLGAREARTALKDLEGTR
ncbi:TPR repeat-containing protein [Streptomyces viridochromogenes DSM 40736]|uniref:TPR repeat-containing protein n=1 Tax=Streptomyces viridochromogenes (strain DSM 40736 / JCM 4977 / BCRC 1201 / Tue 494) TaxID=591159 RepID=D9WYK2_STRVT|nr:tetratricopeptide repeat protein [Streptomyces viridochromogenes]EFL31096.1 TPR repeat-containing protein [Streptomyces viridochromogenes DSM 40736]